MNTSLRMPKHDPELVEIMEENLALRQAATEQDLARKARWEAQANARREQRQQQPEAVALPPAVTRAERPGTVRPNLEQSAEAPELKTAQTQEEILAKNTHYVFIFGYTGAGKSTVLTALNMYMRQHHRVILNQAGNQDGIRLMHQMMRDLETGHFPQPTSIGQITEYDTSFRMNGEDVNLTFLEMAGEDLRKVDVDTGEEGLPDSVKAYLHCPGISISFLLVADYDRVVARKEDRLILQFLSFLYTEGVDLSRVGVLLSKFDRGRTEMNVEEVIRTYLPQVDKWLTSGDIEQPRVFPFSVGEVDSQTGRKDQIREIDLEDCGEVVPWLHQVLSLPGAEVSNESIEGQSWFQRLGSWLPRRQG